MGKIQVENLSGGMYRSSTPSQIPEISWSDIANYDIEDNSIVTRKGATRYNTNPFYPGCVKFGPSSTVRAQFLQGKIGSYFVSKPAVTQHYRAEYAFYGKEISATTSRRALLTIATNAGNSLAEIYYSTNGRLEFKARPSPSQSMSVMTQDQGTGAVIARPSTTCPSFLYYAMIDYDGTGAGTADWNLTLRNYKQTISYAFNTTTAPATSTGATMILGCDSNTTYPKTDWGNAANKSLYGYMGEVVVAKGLGAAATGMFEDMKTSPGRRIESSKRVAYYPLQKDYDDTWGLSPSLGSFGYQTGSGLGNYSVLDPKLKDARHLLNVTKSWHINTFKDDNHVFGLSTTLSPRWRNYFKNKYAVTFDINPVKWGASSYDFPLLEGTTAGPYIRLSRNGADKTTVKFTHRVTAAVTTGTSYSINNNEISKITCQYRYSSATANGQIRLFHNSMQVMSTSVAVSTSQTLIGHLRTGRTSTVSTSCEAYVSGYILHHSQAGNAWGARPQETYSKITTYSTVNAYQYYTHKR